MPEGCSSLEELRDRLKVFIKAWLWSDVLRYPIELDERDLDSLVDLILDEIKEYLLRCLKGGKDNEKT